MVSLTPSTIDSALPRIARGLQKYLAIQARVRLTDVSQDRDFQRLYNGFYRVRRNTAWQQVYFQRMEAEKSTPTGFSGVLMALFEQLGRVEASFASKLVATLDPHQPVLDAFVLANVGLRLPAAHRPHRLAETIHCYAKLQQRLTELLQAAEGQDVLRRFDRHYPKAPLTPLKKLDLVLWQVRSPEDAQRDT